jgi:hypothetical protein
MSQRGLQTGPATGVLGWAHPARPRLARSHRLVPDSMAQTAALVWHGRHLFPWTQRVSWTHLLCVLDPGLPTADFELIALRATWNCGGYDEWAVHNLQDRLLYGSALVERVYVGPDAAEWDERRATVLRAVDELHDDLAVSGTTWAALNEWYDDRQRLEMVLTTGMYELLSLCLRSIGAPRLLSSAESRDPRAALSGPRRRRNPGPTSERHRPGASDEHADCVGLRDPGLWLPTDGTALAAVMAQLPRHFRVLLSAVRPAAHRALPLRDGHLAVLRTVWRDGPGREWAPRLALARQAGVDDTALAGVTAEDPALDRRDGALLRAVDELDTEYFVSEETWSRLADWLTPTQRIELCFLVGHHRMMALTANTLGP